MTRKFILAAISATLVAGSLAGGAFASQRETRPLPPMARPGMFVFMLKNFDANKDGKITAEEAKAGADTLFTQIDTDKDGSLTPKEMRAYHEARMEAMKAAMKDQKAAGDDQAMADGPDGDEGPDGAPPPPRKHGWGKGHHHGMMGHGMMGRGMMRMLDTDENGQVSKAEAEAAADKLVKQMDTNGDGVVSIDDFPG